MVPLLICCVWHVGLLILETPPGLQAQSFLRIFPDSSGFNTIQWVPQGLATSFLHCTMAKRSPWETSPGGAGLYLADLSELNLPDDIGPDEIESIPVDQASMSSIGYALVTPKKASDFAFFRTEGCFFLVTKGFIDTQLVQKGFSANRVFTATLSLADDIVGAQEPRAVTICNCGQNQVDWVSKAEPMTEIDIACVLSLLNFAKTKQENKTGRTSLKLPPLKSTFVRPWLHASALSSAFSTKPSCEKATSPVESWSRLRPGMKFTTEVGSSQCSFVPFGKSMIVLKRDWNSSR